MELEEVKVAQPTTRKVENCFHCGGSIEDEHLIFDDKDFCCLGCRTVYEILNENDLCGYYDLEKNPGIKLKSRSYEGKFDFLEQADVKARLLDFASPELEKIRLYLPAIHCSSCIWLLENLTKLIDGILSSRVNFLKKTLSLDYNPQQTNLKQISELLTTIGYEPEYSLQDFEGKRENKTSRGLVLRIGVAGFSFGNIMLLSFPEYFGFEGLRDESIRLFINYLNLVLALPVFLYCSTPYYESAFKALRKRYINIDLPIVLGIFALFFRSAYEVISQTGAGYFDSLAGLLFFLLVGRWFLSRTYESMSFERDYKAYFPIAVGKWLNGDVVPTPIKDLKPGDKIIIRNGEIIPADSRLLEGEGRIDYSFVSGEIQPQKIAPGELIYAGGRQVGAQIRLEVIKDVSQSYLTGLWNDSTDEKADLSREAMINRLSKNFTIIVLFIAFGSLIFWLLTDSSKALNAFSAVLIVACPCALSMATPFTLGNTMRVFGRNGFYLKNALVVETMARITDLVFDKTGTITQGDKSKVIFEGMELTVEEMALAQAVATQSTHPLSRQISVFLRSHSGKKWRGGAFEEIPGRGIVASFEQHTILLGSAALLNEKGIALLEMKTTLQATASEVWLAIDGIAKGRFLISAEFRTEIQPTIHQLNRNYRLALISGDSDSQKAEMQRLFPSGTEMYFRQSPGDKDQFVRRLKDQGHKVAMIGDGLNDGIALRSANMGIAVSDDVSSFAPASDAILDGNQIHKLPLLFQFASFAKFTIIAAFSISFLYNIVGLAFAVTGNLTPIFAAILMPLSSITVVSFATLSINLRAKMKGLI
jgi:Cu+-exporting ATPase